LLEWQAPWLPGYENSKPVRVGNAAATQLQLDIYGAIAEAVHHARKGALGVTEQGTAIQREWMTHLEKVWMLPDEGIWEVRGARQQFTHSKVMAWVAVDRTIKDFERLNLAGPVDQWRALRNTIHEDICRQGFNSGLGSFVQSYGSTVLDASLLQIPLLGFLPISDPRVLGTIKTIERRLLVDGLVMRYDTEESRDGIKGHEGTFLLCSFWLVDCLTLLGRRKEAQQMFERLLSLRNDLGLLAEEYDPVSHRLLGNFPQAFSHLGLVNSALNLSHVIEPLRQPTHNEQA
jgi:GH15 family glucan-1,4-alpha-glucosidase